jgi:hypothetical protein
MKPFLTKIKTLKIRGLASIGIVASFIRCWVQPLRERVHYGFKYIGVEDPTKMLKRWLNWRGNLRKAPGYPERCDSKPIDVWWARRQPSTSKGTDVN